MELISSRAYWTIRCALATVVTCLAPAFALAQSAYRVCPPILMSDLERAAGMSGQVSAASMDMIDVLHTKYLDEYRAEVAPAARLALRDAGAWGTDPKEMERHLRAYDAALSRVADCDVRFFDAVMAAVPEAERAMLMRARAARERERLCDGYTMAIVNRLGRGIGFVDGVGWLMRHRGSLELPADDSARIEAWMVRHEATLLAQARDLHREARALLVRQSQAWGDFAADTARAEAANESRPSDEDPRIDEDGGERRRQEWMDIEKSLSAAAVEIIATRSRSNRAMLRELAEIVGKVQYDRLRLNFLLEHDRFDGSMDLLLAELSRRLRADPSIERAALDGVLGPYYAARADAMEQLLISGLEFAVGSASGEVDQQVAGLRNAELGRAIRAADAQASEGLRLLLGVRADEFFEQVREPGAKAMGAADAVRWVVKQSLRERPRNPDSGNTDYFPAGWMPIPLEAVERIVRLTGHTDALALTADVYRDWWDSTWEPRSAELQREIGSIAGRLSSSFGRSPPEELSESEFQALDSRMSELQVSRTSLLLEGEEQLAGSLQAVAERQSDGVLRTLLGLQCIRRLGPVNAFPESGSSIRMESMVLPSILDAADATADEVQAIMDDPAWARFANEIRAMARELARFEFGGADVWADPEWAFEEERVLYRRIAALQQDTVSTCMRAFQSAVSDPARRRVFQRAMILRILPSISIRADSTARRIEAACNSATLDGVRLDQILALRAEFAGRLDGFLGESMEFLQRRGVAIKSPSVPSAAAKWETDDLAEIRNLQNEFAYKAGRRLDRILPPPG
jgi:hypothetical protein